jgi:hypothetical protein
MYNICMTELEPKELRFQIMYAKYLTGEIKSYKELGEALDVSQPTLRKMLASQSALEVTDMMRDEMMVMLNNAIAGASRTLKRMVEMSGDVDPQMLPSYMTTFMAVIPKISANAGLHEGTSQAEKHLLSGPARNEEESLVIDGTAEDDDDGL